MAEEDQEEGLVCQELQVLQSIYLEELAISREDRVKLRITLHPATGDDPESQYVRLTLHLSLPPQYPDDPPEISVSNPRGLCDEQIHSISDRLHQTAAESLGGPLLYELIEKGKEMLTASNIPRGLCVICLYGFQEGDSLTKTPCFHHFHSHCLGRYAKHCQEENPTDVLPRTPRPAEAPPSDEAVSASDVERQAGPPSCDGHSAIPLGGKQQELKDKSPDIKDKSKDIATPGNH
ncbi:E3 ubiquitin-protein ligase RNF25 [Mantella aurantiaca]